MAKKVPLECTVCGNRNYAVPARPNQTTRIELKKYCKHCQKVTLHRESR